MSRILHVGDDAALVPSLREALADPAATEIVLHPGTYVEHVVIAPRSAPLLVRSSSGDARDVVVTFGLRQGDRDRTGMEFVQSCATLTIDADDVTLRDITVENSFDRSRHPDLPNVQALAVRTRGDRILIERCRLVGMQDTVLLDTPSFASVRYVHIRDSEIVGDVDFLYGRATALIEGGVIRSAGRGYIAAPSTAQENPRGFLFWRVRLEADLPVGSVKLGRPWHPGGKADAVGQALFAHCFMGSHIHAEAPWEDMGGYTWADARLAEFASTGPGAAISKNRPQLNEEPDRDSWLGGWNRSPAPRPGAVHIASDSTASDYPPERAPRTGWGQCLPEVLGLPVRNHAVSGASSRSFIDSGGLDAMLDQVSAGDVVLVAFGHNDAKPDERFSDVFTGFEANLRRYLVGVRARGGHPVLLTPIERRVFRDGRITSTHGGYPERTRALAAAEDVPLIDLTLLTRRLWQEQGEAKSRSSFLWLEAGAWPGYPDGERDDTHLSRQGAEAVARLVADQLRSRELL